jgi:Flp pilus assembly protein TadD
MANNNKHLCPCGSGKRRKACCREIPRNKTPSVTPNAKLEMRRTVESLIQNGKHLEACAILEKLSTLSPNNPLIWNDLGVQYEAAGHLDKALIALKRGHKVDSTYPPTLYNLGKFTLDLCTTLNNSGVRSNAELQVMLGEAIHFLNANLDRDPDNADGHFQLALAYALNQDEPMAQAHMTVALKLKQAKDTPPGWRIK